MARQTQAEILNEVLNELQEIKRGLPNGEIALMQKSLEDLFCSILERKCYKSIMGSVFSNNRCYY